MQYNERSMEKDVTEMQSMSDRMIANARKMLKLMEECSVYNRLEVNDFVKSQAAKLLSCEGN